MRNLLITGIYPPDIGGPATFIPKLAKHLKNQGMDVEIVTLNPQTGVKNPDAFAIKTISRNLIFPIRFLMTVLIIRSSLTKETNVFANGLHEESAIALSSRKSGYAVAKIVGDPVWERARNSGQTKLDILDFQTSALTFTLNLQRKLLKWALNKFDVVTCPSRELCEFVSGWGVKSKTIYIPNGVQIDNVHEIEIRDLPMITASRLVPWKNTKQTIELAKSCGSHLTILGDGPLRSELIKYALEIGADVSFLGNQSQESMSSYFKRSKIFVLISDYEGMSFALLQAMASGCIPFVSDIRGNLELVSEGVEGFTASIEKIHELHPKINSILRDEDLRSSMSKAAVKKIQKFFNEEDQLNKFSQLMQGNKSG